MKHGKLIGGTLVALFVSICSSCLHDIDSVYNPGISVAVMRHHGDSAMMMANTRFGWLYAPTFSSHSDGQCYLLDFIYDPNLPENKDAEEKGFYTVEIKGEKVVDRHEIIEKQTEESKLLSNEQAVLAVNPNDSALFVMLEKYLFLPSACLTTEGRSLDWQMTYDLRKSVTAENKKSVYALYLRVVATNEKPEGVEVKPLPFLNAFDLTNVVRDIKEQTGRESDTYIQIHYVNWINPSDSAHFEWQKTEPLKIN